MLAASLLPGERGILKANRAPASAAPSPLPSTWVLEEAGLADSYRGVSVGVGSSALLLPTLPQLLLARVCKGVSISPSRAIESGC